MIKKIEYTYLSASLVKLMIQFSDNHVTEMVLNKEDVDVLAFNLNVLSSDMVNQEATCQE